MGRVFAVSEDPFAPAAEAGIHRLAIPTPFAVGRVNTYLIEDDPLTLVDTGLLLSQPNDTKDDFADVFDFEDAFEREYPWSNVQRA